jgi:hypothetical protein
MGKLAFLYFGVSSAGETLLDFSGEFEGLVDLFCAANGRDESRKRQRAERRRISFFFS